MCKEKRYEIIKDYTNEEYRRITGVKRKTFEKMVEILSAAYKAKHQRRGRKSKLSIGNMLLATFGYLWEYRTYAHIEARYGLDESNIYHIAQSSELKTLW